MIDKPIKLHLGCGTEYKNEWINVDNNSDNNIKKLDVNWDLTSTLPFPEDSIDFIFNEHFLEHLTVEEGLKSLRDFKRILKPKGVMRIAMPDLAWIVGQYSNTSWKSEAWIRKFNLDFVKTKAELINMNFRWWGHKWLYDWEELERRLKEAGFERITKCEHHKSQYLELQNLEARAESILIAEVVK